MIYDFGAGRCRTPGVVAVDIDPASNPDIVGDVVAGVPEIPGGSADEVWCCHVLEHLPHPQHFSAIQEMCRVLRVGGKLVIKVPHPSADSAMVPGHVHVLPPRYWRDIQKNPRGYTGCDLVIDSIDEPLSKAGRAVCSGGSGISPAFALAHLRNVCDETVVTAHKVAP